MTGQLKNLMDRAADLDFAAVDIGAVVEAGDRTVRRRRLALGGGVAAMALVAGSTVVALTGGGATTGRTSPTPPPPGTPLGVVTWTLDGRCTPPRRHPLGHEVTAYVRTATGWSSPTPTGSYGFRHGEITRIGRLERPARSGSCPTTRATWPGGPRRSTGGPGSSSTTSAPGSAPPSGDPSGMGAQADDGDPTSSTPSTGASACGATPAARSRSTSTRARSG